MVAVLYNRYVTEPRPNEFMKPACCLILLLSVAIPGLDAQSGDWPMYNRDPAGTRYSPLTQINTKNVATLTKAWSYALKSAATGRGAPRASGSEATPIVVNGVMYLPAAGRVVALEPATGKEIWRYELPSGLPEQSRSHLLAGR